MTDLAAVIPLGAVDVFGAPSSFVSQSEEMDAVSGFSSRRGLFPKRFESEREYIARCKRLIFSCSNSSVMLKVYLALRAEEMCLFSNLENS
jgi:hypothetical protein